MKWWFQVHCYFLFSFQLSRLQIATPWNRSLYLTSTSRNSGRCFCPSKFFTLEMYQRSVLIKSNNSTVVSYINKQGRTKSQDSMSSYPPDASVVHISQDSVVSSSHSGIGEHVSGQFVQGYVPPKTDRVVSYKSPSLRDLRSLRGFPTIDLFASSYVPSKSSTASLLLVGSGQVSSGMRHSLSIQILWIEMGTYAFHSISLTPSNSHILSDDEDSDRTVIQLRPVQGDQDSSETESCTLLPIPGMLKEINKFVQLNSYIFLFF